MPRWRHTVMRPRLGWRFKPWLPAASHKVLARSMHHRPCKTIRGTYDFYPSGDDMALLAAMPADAATQETMWLIPADEQLRAWNGFVEDLRALHMRRVAEHEVLKAESLGGYQLYPDFYREVNYTDKKNRPGLEPGAMGARASGSYSQHRVVFLRCRGSARARLCRDVLTLGAQLADPNLDHLL